MVYIKKNKSFNPPESSIPSEWDCNPTGTTAYPGGCYPVPQNTGQWSSLQDCLDANCYPGGTPCFQVGNIGPAGGIIVATPYMNVWDPIYNLYGPTVPSLQGSFDLKNPTEYYYELSPDNLNLLDCNNPTIDNHSSQWGSDSINFASNSLYADYWLEENVVYTGAIITQYNNFLNVHSNEMIGEGQQATIDMMAVNSGLPLATSGTFICNNDPTNQYVYNDINAFELCTAYNQGGYNDWFLPTTNEMGFARNYTPPGTLYDSTGEWNDFYWTCNAPSDDITTTYIDNWMSLQNIQSAFAVHPSPITGTAGPYGEQWRSQKLRSANYNVRAMRRFTCADVPPVPEECYVYYGAAESWLNKNPPGGGSVVQLATATDKATLLTNNGIFGAVSNGTSAKYGNKVYEFYGSPSGYHIIEFIIDSINDTLSFGQAYTIGAGSYSFGIAACMKDANTILMGHGYYGISEIHLQPGGTFLENTLFPITSPYLVGGGSDMIYRPSDNTIIITVIDNTGTDKQIHHYDYNGVLLDSLVIDPPVDFGNAMFCSGGSIFIHNETPDNVYEIETNPLLLSPSVASYPQPGDTGDASSNPECCVVGAPPEPEDDCSLYGIGTTIGSLNSYLFPDPSNSTTSLLLNPVGYSDKTAALAANGIITPVSGGVGSQANGTTARYQNKGYDLMSGPSFFGIVEWTINPSNLTIDFVAAYTLLGPATYQPGILSAYGSAMCSKDANTLLLAEWDVSEVVLNSNGTFTPTHLFKLEGPGYTNTTGYSATGDIVYRPIDDTMFITAHIYDQNTQVTLKIFHYDMNGTVLDSLDITNPVTGSPGTQLAMPTLFCSGGRIFGQGGMYLFEIETNPLNIVNNVYPFQLGPNASGDGGTSPECCNTIIPPRPDPCDYIVGDIGPGGGIIVVEPNTAGNTSNYYYEMGLVDLAVGTTSTLQFQGVPQNIIPGLNPIPGAEWGAYKTSVSLSANNTSTLFGEGVNNTNVLVANTPFYFNDSVAAQLCATYNGGGFIDWFLPSLAEFHGSVNSGAFNDTLYPGNGQYKPIGLNWTSSAHYQQADLHLDGKAYGFDASTVSSYIGYRPYTLSVRPMRRFDCPPPPPCVGPTCVDYNWVDGGGNLDGGCIYNSYSGHPFSSDDSVLGGTTGDFVFSSEDVLGNIYTPSMFNVGDEVIIKAWRFDYTYFGTWKYTIANVSWWPNPNWCINQMIYIQFDNVVHLDGPNQYVATNNTDYVNETGTSLGSATQTFIQITTPATAATGLANGTQATMWGNLPYTGSSYFANELPYRCTTLVGSHPGCTSSCPVTEMGCVPTYTVNPNYTSTLPNQADCFNLSSPPSFCCGGASIESGSVNKAQVKRKKCHCDDNIIYQIKTGSSKNINKDNKLDCCGKK
jgi:hypothetical protein